MHLLEEVDRYLAGGTPENSPRAEAGRERAVELFGDRLEAALRLYMTYKSAGTLWPLATHGMPSWGTGARAGEIKEPQPRAAGPHNPSWTAVLGWCALEAIGTMRDPQNPDPAAAELFDALRLRGPLAAAFGAEGLAGDEDWRAAARLRASFAHSSRSYLQPAAQRASRLAGAETPHFHSATEKPPVSGTPVLHSATERTPLPGTPLFHPQSWIHDPDVAWAIGVHEHEGVSYLVKEHLERLMWWMALRDLLEVAAAPAPRQERVMWIEEAIRERMHVAERGGYRVEVLEEMALFDGAREREAEVQKRS
jgi:hypothetical protein